MKKLVALVIALFLVLSLTVPALAAKPSMDNLWKTTPDELPVLKMVWETGAKGGVPGPPPGKGKPDEPTPEPEVNKWAVIVGISDYPGVESDLWHADDDAQEMRDALIGEYGFPEGNIKLLLDRKAKARDILRAIDWLAGREDTDSSVLFFFCGHGFSAPDAENWDSDLEADSYDEGIVSWDMYGLPDGMLREKFATFETNKLAMVFGSCFSGGMFDDDDDLQETGRVITAGCKSDQYCWDYYDLGNTLFGYYFIDQGILSQLADDDSDGNVSIEEAFAYAEAGVESHNPAPPEPQEPVVSDMYTGELVP